MSKTGFSLIAAVLILCACSKEKKIQRKIEGSWNVKEWSIQGNKADLTGTTIIFTFDDCKEPKKNCSGSRTIDIPVLGKVVSSFSYSLNKETITIFQQEEDGSQTVYAGEISGYKGNDLKIITGDGSYFLLKRQ